MIVTCPACSANYRINASIIDPRKGRIVRCSACGNGWRIFPPSKTSQILSKDKKKRPKSNYGIWSLIIIIICLKLLVFGFGYLFRQDIIKTWPQAERLYQIIGIDGSVTGISLVMPYLEKINHADGRTSLLIQGSFLNSDPNETLKIPPLRILLLDSANKVVAKRLKTDFIPASLPAGGRSDFTFEIPDLPKQAVDVRIELIEKTEK